MAKDADALLSPWHPIKDPVDLKHLGKLAEELAECLAAVSRCIIQGVDEREPVTGVLNRDWLTDEIADVRAGLSLAVQRFNLDQDRITDRMMKKTKRLREWHGMA